MSNLSDMSGNTAIQTGRPRMDVACVIDTLQAENLTHRKCALDELRQACSLVNANLQQIQVSTNAECPPTCLRTRKLIFDFVFFLFLIDAWNTV